MIEEKVKQRIAKCKQALNDADYLMQDERYLAAVNRMYYAVFYIVMAYFTNHNWVVKSHSGTKTKVHLELTSKGLITTEEGKLYNLLFQRRHEFDYEDFVTYSVNEVTDMYNFTKSFIQKIESLITIHE